MHERTSAQPYRQSVSTPKSTSHPVTPKVPHPRSPYHRSARSFVLPPHIPLNRRRNHWGLTATQERRISKIEKGILLCDGVCEWPLDRWLRWTGLQPTTFYEYRKLAKNLRRIEVEERPLGGCLNDVSVLRIGVVSRGSTIPENRKGFKALISHNQTISQVINPPTPKGAVGSPINPACQSVVDQPQKPEPVKSHQRLTYEAVGERLRLKDAADKAATMAKVEEYARRRTSRQAWEQQQNETPEPRRPRTSQGRLRGERARRRQHEAELPQEIHAKLVAVVLASPWAKSQGWQDDTNITRSHRQAALAAAQHEAQARSLTLEAALDWLLATVRQQVKVIVEDWRAADRLQFLCAPPRYFREHRYADNVAGYMGADTKMFQPGLSRPTAEENAAAEVAEVEQIAAYIEDGAARIEAAELAPAAYEAAWGVAAKMRALAAVHRAEPLHSLVELDRELSNFNAELLIVLTESAGPAEVESMLKAANNQLAPYRGKMQPAQIEEIRRQFMHKRLLEEAGLPRLSVADGLTNGGAR